MKYMTMYDVCIVGAGMIGSAAARHASLIPGTSVCLIGPREPNDREEATLFGAYFDEGRITRCVDPDPVWGTLASKSIERYRALEQRTGIQFYTEVGCLTDRQLSDEMLTVATDSDNANHVTIMDKNQTRRNFPYLHVFHDVTAMETKNAGHINPRRMVAAEQTAAHLQGADIIIDIVNEIKEISPGDGAAHMLLTCQSGREIISRKILLATGAFTSFRKLLPPGLQPRLELKTQSIIFAEVSNKQLGQFRGMPSMLLTDEKNNDKKKFSIYVVPPLQYPDGRYYMKLGHGAQYERTLDSEEEVTEWFRQQPPEYIKQGLLRLLRGAFTDFQPASVKYDTCVTSVTPNKRPYIDLVTSRLGVALGGNGYAAKSCDEIGRLSVQLLLSNKWEFPFPRESMKLKWKTEKSAKL